MRSFVEAILNFRRFNADRLTDLFPAELHWKERAAREHKLMSDLRPLLENWSEGREIAGLRAYE